VETAWLHVIERKLSAPSPDGKVYCRECLYLGQRFLPSYMRRRAVPYARYFRCRHANALVVIKDWDGMHHLRVPPWQRNADNNCADFVPRTLRNRVLAYPYRTGAWVLGLTGLLMWVFGW
jgi:hypothetical protein